ncbi:MAG TPA: hemerythrin family protein [Stellaceae bacterium]|nr:hemerythrin family protein [Stellaceae bacterium]
MVVVWRDQMSVDGGLIDDDHRVLIAIINEFAETKPTPSAIPVLAAVLTKLDRYTKTHFEREESLQKSVNYTFHDAHKHDHKDLIRQLSEVREELKGKAAARNPADIPAMHARMADFLYHWLIDHILEKDLRMRPFTKAMREYASKLNRALGE